MTAAGRAITFEAGLAFLGLGDPTRASWGTILRDGLDFSGLFFTDPWKWWLIPPLASVVVLLAWRHVPGTALERHINPRLTRHHPGGVRSGR